MALHLNLLVQQLHCYDNAYHYLQNLIFIIVSSTSFCFFHPFQNSIYYHIDQLAKLDDYIIK